MKKKILFVGHEASITGAPRSLLNIATLCKSNGFEVVFIIGKGGELLSEYEKLGITYIWSHQNQSLLKKILNKLFGDRFSYMTNIINKINGFGPDLIFNNTIVNGSIVERLKKLNKPIISRIPELETVIQFFNINGDADKVFSLSDKFVAVSEAVRKNIVENHSISNDKITLIPGFSKEIDVSFYKKSRQDVRNMLGISPQTFVVGNCSNLIFRKGFDFFISVAEILQEYDVCFIWVGGKKKSLSYYEVLEEINKRGLSQKVKFIDEQANVYPYLSAFDIFFLSSREEPFSISMIEAAQFSLPVLGFRDSGGVEEFLADGGGFLHNYGDIMEVSKNISLLMNNATLYRQLSECSYKNYQRYHKSIIEPKWIKLLLEVTA